jgi:DNA-binding MarR family transcriptional regulator
VTDYAAPSLEAEDPLSPVARLNLEHFLPYRLSVLTNRVSQVLAREYHGRFGVTVHEWRVMAVLGRYQPLSATGVGERTSMGKVKVSRAVASMVEKGLLVRQHRPSDHRVLELCLSPAGRRMHAEIAKLALERERELTSVLRAEEHVLLFELLDRLQAQVSRMQPRALAELDHD